MLINYFAQKIYSVTFHYIYKLLLLLVCGVLPSFTVWISYYAIHVHAFTHTHTHALNIYYWACIYHTIIIVFLIPVQIQYVYQVCLLKYIHWKNIFCVSVEIINELYET